MKAAVGRVEITTEKIQANDSLFAKILLLEQDGVCTALISLDYISLGGEIGTISDAFFPSLKTHLQAMGVSALLCGTTHTHTFEPMIVEEFVVLQRIEEKVKELLQSLEEVSVFYSLGKEDSFTINRNIPTKDGGDWTVRLAHALPPENAYETLAKVDDRIQVLQFVKDDGKPLCVLFNFGCHPLLGMANNRATANFPGAAEAFIENATGATALFFQSAGGDVCEIGYKNYFAPKDFHENGFTLGLAVVNAMKNVTPLSKGYKIATEKAVFPLRKDYDGAIENLQKKQLEICNRMQNSPLNFKNFLPLYLKYLISPEFPLDHKYVYLKESERNITQLKDQDELNRRHIEKYLQNIQDMELLTRLGAEVETLRWHKERVARLGDSQEVEITGIQIGEIVLISAPFEPLTNVALRLKELYGDTVMLLSYSNGYCHYGATQEKYGTGAYETRECDLSPEWQDVYFKAVAAIIARLKGA